MRPGADRRPLLIDGCLEGTLSDGERLELSDLLTRDAALRAYLSAWLESRYSAELTRLGPSDVARARGRLEERLRMEVRRRQRRTDVQRRLAWAAVTLLVAILPFIASISLHPRERHRAPMPYLVTLSDGSEIALVRDRRRTRPGAVTYEISVTMPRGSVAPPKTLFAGTPTELALRLHMPADTAAAATLCGIPGATCTNALNGGVVVAFATTQTEYADRP
jgi:anti-sigma factor RsiW